MPTSWSKREGMRIHIRTNLPPHPLDARIWKLATELRRLILERGHFFTGLACAGRPVAAETIAKRAAKLRGQKRTPEQRERMRQAKLRQHAQP